MAIHNMEHFASQSIQTHEIPARVREKYNQFPQEFLIHMRQSLRDPQVLLGHLSRITTEVSLLRDFQMAIPHTCMKDDIDYEFDAVIDKLEETIQYINNWLEEKAAGEKLAREFDNSFYARR